MNVGESVEPGHGLHVTLTSMLPFAECTVRKITVTKVAVSYIIFILIHLQNINNIQVQKKMEINFVNL